MQIKQLKFTNIIVRCRLYFDPWLYCKLEETFHVVSECKTAFYFSWSLMQVLSQSVQLFWPLVTFSVASSNSLTGSLLEIHTSLKLNTQNQVTFYKSLIHTLWTAKSLIHIVHFQSIGVEVTSASHISYYS